MSELTPIKVSLFPKTNLLAAESFYVLFADSEKGFGVSSKIRNTWFGKPWKRPLGRKIITMTTVWVLGKSSRKVTSPIKILG